MPKVGNKQFAYTPEGEQAAEDFAIETGQEVIPSYDAGGRVRNIEGYGEDIGIDSPVGPSNLVANGEMTQEEVDKYIKPQLMKKGGKVKKKGKKTYSEKADALESIITIDGVRVTSRKDLMAALQDKELRAAQPDAPSGSTKGKYKKSKSKKK